MEANKIQEILQTKFGAAVQELAKEPKEAWAKVGRDQLLEIAQFVKSSPEISLDMLHCVTGVDLGGGVLECIYTLTSTTHHHWFHLKVDVKTDNPKIPSVSHLWKTANWHEREAFDLLGIVFGDHPNLKRILCEESWVGHPLRKDYEFPKQYDGIPRDILQEDEDAVLPRTTKKN